MDDAANRSGQAEARPRATVDDLARAAGAPNDPPPPVHLWNPPYCGDIGMEIRADGMWWYQGTPIGRPALVRLFSRILRRDDDGKHYLVTPVEKVDVKVERTPFLAVRVDDVETDAGPGLAFTTNVGDVTVAGPGTPLTVTTDPETGEPDPVVRVRGALDALVCRPVFFELVERAVERPVPGGVVLEVLSSGCAFALGPPLTEEER